ncbi:MAG: beta-lactamase family protein [Alistipes sp.]|nr:beta-lactamase family protein [Alistipes sp.]
MRGWSTLKIRSVSLLSIVIAIGFVIAINRACSTINNSTVTTQPESGYRLNNILKDEYSDNEAFKPMERYIINWMNRNGFQGATLAIMKDEKLIYCKGLGWADKEAGVEAHAGNIFRMASASKLITAIAVMKLCEEGKLSLNSKVFGEKGILKQFTEIRDKRAKDITVEHLLNHTSGLSRRLGDLTFRTQDVIKWAHLDHAPSTEELIEFQLTMQMRDKPGGSAQYSNVGYLILSYVIEKVSGEKYEDYVRKHVLEPAGCYDMHLTYNSYEQRYPNEVKYYGHDEGELIRSYDNSGRLCLREYGGHNIRGLQGAGAWAASSAEMMRLVASIDGKPGVPDILSAKSIKKMKTPTKKDGFGFGWASCTGANGVLTRTGTMSGTCAFIEYNPKGYSYVFISNTSHFKGAKFTNRVDDTIKEAMRRVKEWPTDIDLFTMVPEVAEEQIEEQAEKE